MGALYRARDPLIGRYVAIKLLRAGYDSQEFRERFAREARSAGGLSHPNIVTIYDVGEHEGMPFIAMEYVRGETFADLIQLRPPLPLARKLQLTEEVCAGLAHAHEAGIVHRDIKPANLIVGPEGTVKILDFGIAKLTASGITVPGSIVGTLNYMSPEQLLGQNLDARSDIFSLGAVLYELIAHQPAFPGKRLQEVTKQILSGSPAPITNVVPDLDPRLVRLLGTLLQKDPGARIQDMAEVRRTLAAIRTRSGEAGPPPARRTPPPPSVSQPPQDPDALARQRRRDTQVSELLASSNRAFDAADFEAALEACKQVLLLDASEERAIAQIARVHAAIDARQAETEIREARHQLAQGALTAARRAVDAAETLCADHPEIAALRQAVAEAEQSRARTVAITTAIARGQDDFQRGQFEAAVREADRAMALDPQNQAAKELRATARQVMEQREAEKRLRAVVDSARLIFDRGQHQAAIRQLEALPGHQEIVATALADLRARLAAIQEQQRLDDERAERVRQLAALEADARRALAAGQFDAVRQAVDRLRAAHPESAAIKTIETELAHAEAAAALRRQVEDAVRDVDARIAAGELEQARRRVDEIAATAPADAQVRGARTRLEAAVAAKAAREAAEARRRDGDQKLRDAEARLLDGDLTGAGSLLAAAATLVPDDARLPDLSGRLSDAIARREAEARAARVRQEVATLMLGASQRVQQAAGNAGELVAALRDIKQALTLDPANAEAQSLQASVEASLTEIRENARIATAIDNARRRFANGKHQAAIQLLEEITPAAHPAVVTAIEELKTALAGLEAQRKADQERADRQARITSLLSDARAALHALRFDEALAMLETAESVEPGRADVAALAESVRQTRTAAEMRAKVDQLLADLDRCFRDGELDQAAVLLQAGAELGNDSRLDAARRRLSALVAERDAAAERARQCAEKTAAAAALFDQGDLDGAKRLLDEALALDRQHLGTGELAARVAGAIAERQAAEEAERQRRLVEDLVAEVARHLDASPANAGAAARSLARALQLAPEHAGALELKPRVDAAVAAEREAARIRAEVRNARTRFGNGKHQAAIQLLESLDPTAHPEVADALAELKAMLEAVRAKDDAARAARVQQASDLVTVIVEPPKRGRPEGAGAPDTGSAPTTEVNQASWIQRLAAGEFGPVWALAAAGVALLVLLVGFARC